MVAELSWATGRRFSTWSIGQSQRRPRSSRSLTRRGRSRSGASSTNSDGWRECRRPATSSPPSRTSWRWPIAFWLRFFGQKDCAQLALAKRWGVPRSPAGARQVVVADIGAGVRELDGGAGTLSEGPDRPRNYRRVGGHDGKLGRTRSGVAEAVHSARNQLLGQGQGAK